MRWTANELEWSLKMVTHDEWWWIFWSERSTEQIFRSSDVNSYCYSYDTGDGHILLKYDASGDTKSKVCQISCRVYLSVSSSRRIVWNIMQLRWTCTSSNKITSRMHYSSFFSPMQSLSIKIYPAAHFSHMSGPSP